MTEQTVSRNTVFLKFGGMHLALACVIALLFAANSVAGMVFSDTIYPSPELYNSFLPNDYINLFLGIPLLIASAALALNKIRLGLAGWGASLLFILYNDIAYLFAVHNAFSIIIGIVLGLLCILQLVMMGRSINYDRLIPKMPCIIRPGVYGVILTAMGLVFAGRALSGIVGILSGSADLTPPEIGVNIADAVVSLIWIVSGIMMFKKSRFGYAAGFISYLHGLMLFLSLIIYMIIQPLMCGTVFAAVDLAVIIGMSLMIWVPGILLGRGLLCQSVA